MHKITIKNKHLKFKLHPWHGVFVGDNAPEIVTCYIEVVPTDTVKFEVDKQTGFLKIDRPQKYSNVVPALYGFVPQTLCADKVGAFCSAKTGRADIKGDGDPIDVLVLTEKNISHGDILCEARPIGGFRMIDGNEADDKIICVLKGDAVYGDYKDLSDCSLMLIDRLKHYFLTYKDMPDREKNCEITHIYGKEEAQQIIQCSLDDYFKYYGEHLDAE
ncbi:MAG: inorganic pyrophosphatase [Bacteroidota bacterium]